MIILGISGSISKDSATVRLLKVALDGARHAGAEIDTIDLRDVHLPYCDGRDDVDTYPIVVQDFRDRIRAASGVILATPEYHNSLSGVLKNALDLLSVEDLSGKMCGLLGVAGGGHGAINALNSLRLICRAFGAWVVPQQVSISRVGQAFAQDGTLTDDALARRIRHLGEIVATNAARHGGLTLSKHN